jgi:hypothetical protein
MEGIYETDFINAASVAQFRTGQFSDNDRC